MLGLPFLKGKKKRIFKVYLQYRVSRSTTGRWDPDTVEQHGSCAIHSDTSLAASRPVCYLHPSSAVVIEFLDDRKHLVAQRR